MDTVTHLVSGVLAGQAVSDRFPRGRWLIPFAAFCAWMPDIDNVVSVFGTEAFMRYHRSYTHSLLGGALLSVLVVWLMRLYRRDLPPAKTFALAYGCLLMHLFLDVITTYGTQIFLPFSDARVSVPALFIVDPPFTLALIGLAVASFAFKARGKALAVAGLAAIFLYPAANVSVREMVAGKVERMLLAEGRPISAVHVQPDGFAPVWWKVIAEEGDSYRVTGLDLLHPDTLLPEKEYAKCDKRELQRLGESAPILSLYAWFTDYPVQSVADNGVGEAITFQDLRFFSVNPLVAKVRGAFVPFTLTAELDSAGHVLHVLSSRLVQAEAGATRSIQ